MTDQRRHVNWSLRDDRKTWLRKGGVHGLGGSWGGSVAERFDRGTVARSSYVSSGMAVLDQPIMNRSTATSAAMLRAVAAQQATNAKVWNASATPYQNTHRAGMCLLHSLLPLCVPFVLHTAAYGWILRRDRPRE